LISITEIKEFFKGKISLNEPLAPYTTFRIGGVADYLVEPVDAEDLLSLVRYCSKRSMPYHVMGNGSNILISDEGIRGVVINLESGFNYLRRSNGGVLAGAGVKMAKFVDFCIENSYAGVEMIAGIPATIGGALVMNAGCYGGETSTYVTEIQAIRDDRIMSLTKEQCGFVYRGSGLKNTVIMQARFTLPHGEKAELLRLRKNHMIHRNQTQPVEIPNAGCIFKNPDGFKAAILIEECGLKGEKLGGAMVSPKHSNFIVNTGSATANDVMGLVKKVKDTVKKSNGVELELEIKLVGFEEAVL